MDWSMSKYFAYDKKRLIQLEGKLSVEEVDLIDEGLRKVLCL